MYLINRPESQPQQCFVSLVKIDSWGSGKEDFFKDVSVLSFSPFGKTFDPFKQIWIPSLHLSVLFVQSLQEKKPFKVCMGFFVPLQNISLIWRNHLYCWKAANFDLCSALMAIEQWGFILACHIYCDTGHSFIMVVSKDAWHSHLLPSI